MSLISFLLEDIQLKDLLFVAMYAKLAGLLTSVNSPVFCLTEGALEL